MYNPSHAQDAPRFAVVAEMPHSRDHPLEDRICEDGMYIEADGHQRWRNVSFAVCQP